MESCCCSSLGCSWVVVAEAPFSLFCELLLQPVRKPQPNMARHVVSEHVAAVRIRRGVAVVISAFRVKISSFD